MSGSTDDLLAYTHAGVWPERRAGRFAARVVDLHARTDAPDSSDRATFAAAGFEFSGIGLLGLADDEGVRLNGGRVGARQGPDAFRAGLAGYGAADSVALAGLRIPVFDLGNIEPGATLTETHDRITATVANLLEAGLMPVGIGGGHDMTFPEVRAVVETLMRPAARALTGVYFDAHLDVREDQGSGMPFRRLIEHGGIEALHLFGFDPLVNSPAHLDWFERNGGIRADWSPRRWPVTDAQFVSICLDVIDMSQAPGVSAPHPAGWSAARVADYAEAAGRHPAVCCFDIMELSPPFDEQGRTARLAAHLFLRFLTGLRRRAASD